MISTIMSSTLNDESDAGSVEDELPPHFQLWSGSASASQYSSLDVGCARRDAEGRSQWEAQTTSESGGI